ncbi:MAG: Gfo/Idh/MocA family oxidoreductase [Kiritimatiellae bacterium]|nr:Gfo/Idh/MocA family oxidoreductase [Kiritimatiellia bacterium]
MKKKLKMAMVGGGVGAFIGRIHRMAVGMDGQAELVAGIFNRDPAQNASVGAELGVAADRLYPSWEALIAGEATRAAGDRADFVCICTPNHLHHPIAKAALESGFHVMCEKPIALTSAEAVELARLAKRRKRVFGLMHTYAGYPMVKLARDLVRRGDLGRICKVTCEYQQGSFRKMDFSQPLDKRNKWKMDPKCSGVSCCMGDIGVHAANLVEYVTGLKIKSLLADLTSFVAPRGLDDDGNVLLRLEGGAKGVIMASKVATGEENGLRLRVYGDKKGLVWQQEDPNALHVRAQREPEQVWKRANPYVKEVSPASARASRPPAGHPEGFIEGFANHYLNFCDAVRAVDAGETPPPEALDFPNAEDGVRGMRFIEATVASSRAGGVWVKVG